MEIVTLDQLQKYSSFFYDNSILTRINIPKPTSETQILVLSKIFSSYKMCTVCLISLFTHDIVIEAYKIQKGDNVEYYGGIELLNCGGNKLKAGHSYIVDLDESKYIPLLVLDNLQIPILELVESSTLYLPSTANNKKTFIKQASQIWFGFMMIMYFVHMFLFKE